jgi:hypothetical protein
MLEKEEEEQRAKNLEKKITEVYRSIPNYKQAHEVTTKVKIQQIV